MKFADGMKIFSVVKTEKDMNKLQNLFSIIWVKGHEVGSCYLMFISVKLCTLDKIISRQIMK